MQVEQATITQKLCTILQSTQKLPSLYQPTLTQLKQYQNSNNIPHHQQIRIETFYSLLQPALYSLQWEKPEEEVLYPVGLVLACWDTEGMGQEDKGKGESKDEGKGKFVVGLNFVTWVESGGTRCIPLKPNSSQQQIIKYLKTTNSAILTIPSPCPNLQPYKPLIETILKILQTQSFLHYPILFVGRAASILGLQALTKLKLQHNEDGNTGHGMGEIFIDHGSELFSGLDLGIRVVVQNSRKVAMGSGGLSLNAQQLREEGYCVQAKMIRNTNTGKHPITVLIQPMREPQSPHTHSSNKFFLLLDPTQAEHPETIQLWHCLINNFINISKKYKKEIDEKFIDKNLVHRGKVVYRGLKGYYTL